MVFSSMIGRSVILKDLTKINELGVRDALNSSGVSERVLLNVNGDLVQEYDLFRNSDLVVISISDNINNVFHKIREASYISKVGAPVLLITDIINPRLYIFLASLGINGIMTFKESHEVFVDLFNTCLMNGRKFSPYVMEQLDDKFPALLSPAEANLVFDILEGKRITDLAKERGRNIKTISTQKSSIIKRLKISKKSELSALGGLLNNFTT